MALLAATSQLAAGTRLDRIDPRTRIMATFLFAILVVTLSKIVALSGALAAAATVVVMSGQPMRKILRRVVVMESFLVVILVMLPFTTPGTEAFRLFGLGASIEGMQHGMRIVLSATAIMIMALALLGSLDPSKLAYGLSQLGLPAKLVHLMLFTIRYVHVLEDEATRLRTSMKSRGFVPATNRHTWRTYGYLVGMMLVRALDRSERLLKAMKCRGFDGTLYLGDPMQFGRRDVAFGLAFVLLGSSLLALEILS